VPATLVAAEQDCAQALLLGLYAVVSHFTSYVHEGAAGSSCTASVHWFSEVALRGGVYSGDDLSWAGLASRRIGYAEA